MRTRQHADVALKNQNGLQRPSTGVLHRPTRQDARIYCLAARWHYAGGLLFLARTGDKGAASN